MSILKGLVTKNTITSSQGNLENTIDYQGETFLAISCIYACGKKIYSYRSNQESGAEYPRVSENQDMTSRNYVYSIVCRDSVSNEIIPSDYLNFEIMRINGEYNYTTNKTIDAFNVVFNDIPKDKTIKMTVGITGSSFLETVAQIMSNGKITNHIQEVRVVSLYNVPNGVGVAQQNIGQTQNGTSAEVVIDIPSNEGKNESASFSIPQGTKFYDKDGNTLSGDLVATFSHFSPTNQEAVNMFNPGWVVGSIITENGLLQDDEAVRFITAGFFSLEISDSSGRVADNISDSTPIRARTSVDPSLINPITGAPYAVGDTITYWRINKDGIWEAHDTAVVIQENGQLFMTFDVSSFSQGNLDVYDRCVDINGRSAWVSVDVSPDGISIDPPGFVGTRDLN